MRILHTSDWHLGQLFYGKSREQEQSAFLDWLLDQVKQKSIDAVIVAGDLFDTGTPPSYARALYNRFIVRLHQESPDCQLILLAGNHDSVAVLNESKALLQALNTRVIAGADPEGISMDTCHTHDDVLIPLTNKLGETDAILCAVPFLRPSDLMRSKAGLSADERKQQLQQQISDYYQQLYQLAKQQYPQQPVVMTGHLTTVGASTSESVKDIYIGTLDAFPASGFPPADYIALGHIHRPQKVAKTEHIRYCGSPLALSFDEKAKEKQVLIAELDSDNGFMGTEGIPVPVFQPMQRITGSLSEIEVEIERLPAQFESWTDGQRLWLEINVKTDDYLSDLQPRIEAMIGDLPVDLLRLRRDSRRQSSLADYHHGAQLDELTPEDVFLKRLEQESLEEERRHELIDCFRQIQGEIKA
ncbi:exonuclease subunit SbcD [Oceanospirillum sp.]|uniref:exonuclease subunit SbcD n=1 Tax=Oceanospirillum sp. TaxID=2021254 RepID=UPI003A9010A1